MAETITKTQQLKSGFELPQVGFGLWKIPKDKTSQIVYDAIKCGYRNLMVLMTIKMKKKMEKVSERQFLTG